MANRSHIRPVNGKKEEYEEPAFVVRARDPLCESIVNTYISFRVQDPSIEISDIQQLLAMRQKIRNWQEKNMELIGIEDKKGE